MFNTFIPGPVRTRLTGFHQFLPVLVRFFWVLETSRTGPVSVLQKKCKNWTGPDLKALFPGSKDVPSWHDRCVFSVLCQLWSRHSQSCNLRVLCAHLPTWPFITPSRLRIPFLGQGHSAFTFFEVFSTHTRSFYYLQLQNGAHHPRKATPIDFTHQARIPLLSLPYPFVMSLRNPHNWSPLPW